MKKYNPTPDGDEICPACSGDCMDYEPKTSPFEEMDRLKNQFFSDTDKFIEKLKVNKKQIKQ